MNSSFVNSASLSLLASILLCVHAVHGADLEETSTLEPYALNDSLITELIKPASVKIEAKRFALEGLELVAEDSGYNSIQFRITVDRRLNLWVGLPNDLRSGHMGTMRLEIDSLINADGSDIHDPALGNSWDASVTIYHRGGEVFSGDRTLRYPSTSDFENLRRVSGRILLHLPVDIEKYEVSAASPASFGALEQHATIRSVEVVDDTRFRLRHPQA